MLFIVATPIGNVSDISARAIEILKKADLILAEDTRSTAKLLTLLGISGKHLESFFEHNESLKLTQVISYIKAGNTVALVSDSGTPLISDPGFKLVRECHKEKIKVSPIPGACAVTSALSVSGLPTDKFLFVGFLPKTLGKRMDLLRKIQEAQKLVKSSVVIYESPYRLIKTLKEIKETWGDIEVCVARELTKVYEEVVTDTVGNVIAKFSATSPKGELVIIL